MELRASLARAVRQVQRREFEEILTLEAGRPLSTSSRLRSLSPFVDKDGTLRVGGRIQAAQLSYQERHPLILPKGGHFTLLLIRDAHLAMLHGRPQLMQSFLLLSKAVHLETVLDLSTQAFLAAFRRFVARRGRCLRLRSDNATNFRETDAELKKMFRAASKFYEGVGESLANDGTEWKFIPPQAPHFSGLWEAGVRSVNHHLRRILGDQTLTFEELTTLLCQIEACLNSRPLYPMSPEASDLVALTLGHFLIGEPLCNLPEAPEPDAPSSPLAR
ncbi:PREDICTED: uncharacterized protein LOC105461136 [Wasmannia auropunctata]|uniref:uncharacterized protein LOC105461136 n=1 Tax=Wasmannia auropunctata TaxID=64793 RepID=UPI0005EDBEBC|nr:PREDICTED: uncharacterized protein LOC105461136 [Wasmannia auropunctata]